MPIICNVPLPGREPKKPSDATFNEAGDITTQRPYRFGGVHYSYDDGNNVMTYRNESQPSSWSRRALSYRRLRLVNP